MTKFYMGLDLSLSRAGCVVLAEQGHGRWAGDWGYALKKDSTEKEKVERMLEIATGIINKCREYRKDGDDIWVAIERYSFSTVKNKKGKAFQSSSQTGLAELHGVVKSQLLLGLGIIPELYSVNTARKVALGKGSISKKDVQPLLEKRGFFFKNNDQADAYVIAECLRKSDVKELFDV